MNRFLFLFILLPLITHAQDTAIIKKQANLIAQATFKGDYKTVIEYTYPALIKLSGGPDKMQLLITERLAELKKQGILSFEGAIGNPGTFYKAGDQLHCLLPEDVIFRTNAGRYLVRSYLLGISSNQGKSWTFLDVGNMPADVLHRLLPNFNNDLQIPPSTKPEFLPN